MSEKLLRQWRSQITKRQKGHLIFAIHYTRYYYVLGVIAIIIGACSSIGIMTTFRNTKTPIDEGFRIASGVAGFFGTIAVGCQTFLDYQGSAAKHKKASDSYEELLRKIDKSLRRIVSDEILDEVKRRYDDISKHAPIISQKWGEDLLYEAVENFIDHLSMNELVPSHPKIGGNPTSLPPYADIDHRSTAVAQPQV